MLHNLPVTLTEDEMDDLMAEIESATGGVDFKKLTESIFTKVLECNTLTRILGGRWRGRLRMCGRWRILGGVEERVRNGHGHSGGLCVGVGASGDGRPRGVGSGGDVDVTWSGDGGSGLGVWREHVSWRAPLDQTLSAPPPATVLPTPLPGTPPACQGLLGSAPSPVSLALLARFANSSAAHSSPHRLTASQSREER